MHNQNRQQVRARIFEMGLVFYKENNNIEQKLKVSCLISGDALPEQWGKQTRMADFFDLKGDLETLLGQAQKPELYELQSAVHPALQPGQTARILRAGTAVGWLGALHPSIMQVIDISGKVYLAELDYELVSSTEITKVTDVSRFPAVRRDLAIVLRDDIQSAEVTALIRKLGGADLQEVGIFDLYQGHNIEIGKKSLALGLTFQHPSRTLSDMDINPIIDSCINALQAEFNAELRSS